MAMSKPEQPESSTGAPTRPGGESLRPEDVVIEDMDEDIGGMRARGCSF